MFHIGVLPNRPVTEVAEIAGKAEELGFEGVWIADSQSIFRDAYLALTASALRTSTLTLATGVTNPVTRHPATIASAIATLDELSGGRALLGIGVGESAVRTVGLRPARLARLEEATHALRALLSGATASWDGTDMRLAWWTGRPVPIWFASTGPRPLELGGRIADGVLFQVGSHPGPRSLWPAPDRGGRAGGGAATPAGSGTWCGSPARSTRTATARERTRGATSPRPPAPCTRESRPTRCPRACGTS